ncbi:MAG: hypothetical protein NVS2B4_09380 [Ramlibacter sp.]
MSHDSRTQSATSLASREGRWLLKSAALTIDAAGAGIRCVLVGLDAAACVAGRTGTAAVRTTAAVGTRDASVIWPAPQPHPDATAAAASSNGNASERRRARSTAGGTQMAATGDGDCMALAGLVPREMWNKKGASPCGPAPMVTGANPRDQLRSTRPARVPVAVSDEPIDEPLVLPEVLVSVLVPVDGVAVEPVPEAPMLELVLGDVALELVLGDVVLELVLGDVVLELVEGDAPIVLLPLGPLLPDVVGALGAVLDELGEVELVLPAVGVLLLVPVPLPLDAPLAESPPAAPPVWATA